MFTKSVDFMKLPFSLILFLIIAAESYSQSSNDILNLLINNKTISQEQADSIRAEGAIKQQNIEAGKKIFPVAAARQIQIFGYTQIRYQALEEKGKKDGFDIRKARLDFTGILTPYLSSRLVTDFADKPKIIDAYAEIKFNDYFNLTLGQFKIPFSAENLTSDRKLDIVDFSQIVDALVFRTNDVIGNQNGRDIGIQLGGALLKKGTSNLLEYRIGVFNGSGINIADTANKSKDITSRLIINPLKGLSLGVSYYNGWGKAVKPSAAYIGKNQAHDRFGVDISYTLPRLSFRWEYIKGLDANIEKDGWFALLGYYVVPQKIQLIVKYDLYDKDISVNNNITTNYVGGINYNFNSWARLQAFYTIREEQGTKIDNNIFSIQYQIGF